MAATPRTLEEWRRPATTVLKVRPPMAPRDVVARRRLLERLDEATRRRCTVVSAGPGYGKSVLLASWARASRKHRRVAWLTLEPIDADPQRLCGQLVAALQEAFRELLSESGTPLLQLGPPPAATWPTFVDDVLVPALAATPEPVTLVIDDAHHLAASREALGVLDTLLRWAPPTLRVVLAGRADPPLALQRLRLAGQLSVLRQGDLACTAEESAALLAASGERLAPADSAALHELTEGWPAALRLAALSVEELDAVPEFLERFLTRDVALADYLSSEVLNGLPNHLRDFVLRATVDDHVCASLLDSVLGSDDAAMLLAECERRNLFLSRLGGEEEWYAWHAMFAGQMRRRLRMEDPSTARRGHVAAAHWWSEHDVTRAARHALTGDDPSLAADVVAEGWLELALAGEYRTILDLVAMLPSPGEQEAELHLARCYAHLILGELPEASAVLKEAGAARAQLPPGLRWRFDGRAAWVQLVLVDHHTALRSVVSEARHVIERAPAAAVRQPSTTYALALLAVGMGEARLQEDLAAALSNLRAAEQAGRATGLPVLECVARAEMVIPSIAVRRLDELERDAVEVLRTAQERGWEGLSSLAAPTGFLGWLAFWRGDAPEALRWLEEARETCSEGDWGLQGLVAYFHGLASLLAGDADAARSDLAEAERLAVMGCMPPFADSLLAGLHAEILAAGGDHAAAVAALSDPPRPEWRLTVCTRAVLLRRSGRASEAIAALDGMEGVVPPNVVALVAVLRALALSDLGDDEAAHAELEAALGMTEPDGILWPFLADAARLAPLLEAHLRVGTAHDAFATSVLERVAAPVEQLARGRHARLTQRELSILRYLRTSMPNAEIAAELFVSVNTVKTHAAAIYRKLGVSNRREAVRHADELGLFRPGSVSGPAETRREPTLVRW